MGIQSRLISLSRYCYKPEHAIAEVWRHHHQKWVAVDPVFNIWYTRDETPLSVLKIHDLVVAGETDRIEIWHGETVPRTVLRREFPCYTGFTGI